MVFLSPALPKPGSQAHEQRLGEGLNEQQVHVNGTNEHKKEGLKGFGRVDARLI
jgi:hypothetical protein